MKVKPRKARAKTEGAFDDAAAFKRIHVSLQLRLDELQASAKKLDDAAIRLAADRLENDKAEYQGLNADIGKIPQPPRMSFSLPVHLQAQPDPLSSYHSAWAHAEYLFMAAYEVASFILGAFCRENGINSEPFDLFNGWSWLELDLAQAQAIREVRFLLESKGKVDSVDNEDIAILQALNNAFPQRMTAGRISGFSRPKVSEKTVSGRLPQLEESGLVILPRGKNKGWTITTKGIEILNALPAEK